MIVVTGAGGFVGRQVVADLAARGIPYRAVSRKALDGAVSVGDIDLHTDWSEALAGADTIIHLAARVHVMNDTESDPLTAFRATNLEGTLALAEQAVPEGVQRIVFVSTVKVNGEATPPGRPFRADDVPAPEDAYAISKSEAEGALKTFGRKTGLEVVIVRPPLVYGPGAKANFAALAKLAAKGIPLPLGSIDNRRSMIGVGNLADLLIECALNDRAAGQTFMASDGQDVSISWLLREMAKAQGAPSRVFPFPVSLLEKLATLTGKQEIMRRLTGSLQVDISHTCETLGWKPPFSVEDGLRHALGR